MAPIELARGFERARVMILEGVRLSDTLGGDQPSENGISALSKKTGAKVNKIIFYLNLLEEAPEIQACLFSLCSTTGACLKSI